MSSSGGPSKSTKQVFVFPGASSSATKRGTDADLSNESSNKKIRIDICTNPAWSAGSAANKIKSKRCTELNASGLLQHTMKEVYPKSLAVTVDGPVFSDNVGIMTLNSTAQPTNDDMGITQDLNEALSPSPIEPLDESNDNYVVFSSDIIVEDDDCNVATPGSMVSTTTVASHNSDTLSSSAVSIVSRSSDGVSSHKAVTLTTTASADAPDVMNIAPATGAQASSADEIEVVLLPALQETKKSTLELLSNNTAKPTTLTRITSVTSGSLICQNPILSTGVSTLGGTSSGLTTTTAMLNRVGVQTALKNQPLMVTSKKLMSEVMQTTAKVSIGNTTISVPLLKPLNSKQLIQPGSFIGEFQKQPQSSNFHTQSGQAHAQTQLNLSKILNVKRGQKPNQPTIVSLSQLQIKPAKIVQAKVLGKKMQMPLQLQQMPTTTLSNIGKSTSSIVTICGSKQTKQSVIHNFGPKMSQLTVLHDSSLSSAVAEEEITNLFNSAVTTADNFEATANTTTTTQSASNIKQMETSQLVERKAALPKESLVVTTQAKEADASEDNSTCVTTIKKVFTPSSASNVPPLLSTLSKHTTEAPSVFKSQQHTINMSSAISIIKQSTPQLVTTATLLNAASSPVFTTDSNLRADLLTGKAALSLSSSGTKLNTSLIPFSKNISLRLTKNNIGVGTSQQPKTTALTVTNSSNVAVHSLSGSPTTEYLSKKINISMPNTLNITEVHVSKSQSSSVSVLRATDTTLKPGMITIVPQTNDVANLQESQDNLQRKTLKVVMPSSSLCSAGKQQMIRSKSVDDTNERTSPVLHAQVVQQSARKHNVDIAAVSKRQALGELDHRQVSATDNDAITKSSNITLHMTSSADNDNTQSLTDGKKSSVPAVVALANTAKHDSHVITKPEESHNVLLKQLLQSTSASHGISQVVVSSTTSALQSVPISDAPSSICNQLLSARIINVRAPSLGMVSSLEAQLARPVIPPVPATAVTPSHVEPELTDKPKLHATPEQQQAKSAEPNIATTPKDVKLKSLPAQLISKETSFVSNPHLTVTSTEAGYRYSSVNPIVTSNPDQAAPEGVTPSNNIAATKPHPPNTNRNINVDYARLVPLEMNDDANKRKHVYSNAAPNVIQLESTGVGDITSSSSNTLSTIVSGHMLHIKPVDEVAQSNFVPSFEDNDSKANEKLSRIAKLYSNAHALPKVDDKNCGNAPQLIATTKLKKLEHMQSTTAKSPVEAAASLKIMETSSDVKPIQLGSTIEHNSVEKEVLLDIAGRMKATNNADKLTTVTKDADFRKKRKRESQKQRRQLHNLNKELPVNTASFSVAPNPPSAKRRPRKFSKVEEDHDNFIENLMTRIRQMQPLQVQEPLLNRNFGICGIQGRSNLTRLNGSHKEIEHQGRNQLLGEYGRARHWDMPTVDNTDNELTKTEDRNKNSLYTMQNDFYDQEFLPVIYKNEYDKHLRFIGLIRERNIEALEIVNRICNSSSKNLFSSNSNENNSVPAQIPYPGLVLNNESTHYLGRMSPVIPMVMPVQQRIKLPLSPPNLPEEESIKLLDVKQEYEKTSGLLEYKMGKNEEMHLGKQTVILSLPSSSVDNILGILKDLANLLHIATPTTYKIVEAPDSNAVGHCRLRMQNRGTSKIRQYSNLQQILNGRRKMCRNCGQLVSGEDAVRVPWSKFPDKKPLVNLVLLSTMDLHFCNKSCSDQYEFQSRSSSDSISKTDQKPTQMLQGTNADTNKELSSLGKIVERRSISDMDERNTTKCRFKYFRSGCFKSVPQSKRLSEKELVDVLFKMNITVSATNPVINFREGSLSRSVEDIRQCILCNQRGDGLSDGPSRLLNFEVDKWVHLNCALWSNGVYETISGGLMNLQTALQVGLSQVCSNCQQLGATVKCFKNRCGTVFHLPCAIKKQCIFYKNKTIHCQQHAPRTEKDNELTSLTVHRRVFVERDENRQVATIMHHSELTNLLRVGSLTFLNVGQLLPHQLEAFHTANHIFPIGYKIIRFYWSMSRPNKRCRYICSIAEVAGRPEFRIQVQDSTESDLELRDTTPKAVWQKILEPIAALRKDCQLVQLFPQFITGEDLFGLTEPAIVRIIESLPGIETLTDYRFKYGRNPLLELPLAINPSGAARTEPKQRQILGWRKPHTQRSATIFNQRTANSSSSVVAGEVACPYSKQFVHSKSSQYKKMKQEWRNNVYLARSKIQGLGLYAARDIEKHTMIIEYIGEVIRTEVSEIREKQYESKNRGIYMFRLDEDRVVDATLSGGLARYINHSCNPNCVTEIVEVDREVRIIIFAKRRINRGEELSYDYKFDIEDDANKIPCMCGAPNCRKWMN